MKWYLNVSSLQKMTSNTQFDQIFYDSISEKSDYEAST